MMGLSFGKIRFGASRSTPIAGLSISVVWLYVHQGCNGVGGRRAGEREACWRLKGQKSLIR